MGLTPQQVKECSIWEFQWAWHTWVTVHYPPSEEEKRKKEEKKLRKVAKTLPIIKFNG